MKKIEALELEEEDLEDKREDKVWTLGELRKQPPRNTGIKVTKSRQALTLRWGKWKNFPYDIPLEHLKTERGILKWTLHLAEKSWVSREQLEDFMQAALEVAGIDIHNAPKLDSVNDQGMAREALPSPSCSLPNYPTTPKQD